MHENRIKVELSASLLYYILKSSKSGDPFDYFIKEVLQNELITYTD